MFRGASKTISLVEGERALVIESAAKHLVVSDLHLGLEETLSKKGVHLPAQSGKAASLIVDIGKSCGCDSLMLLGDVKDEVLGVSPWGMSTLSEFFETVSRSFEQTTLIPGNHDGGIEDYLPAGVKLASPRGILIKTDDGDVALLHGHAEPSPRITGAATFVMGHRHFVIRIGRKPEPVWVRGRFGVNLSKTLVLVPPFNHLLPGATAFRGERRESSYVSKVVSGAKGTLEAFLLDGTNLGTLSSLEGSIGAADS